MVRVGRKECIRKLTRLERDRTGAAIYTHGTCIKKKKEPSTTVKRDDQSRRKSGVWIIQQASHGSTEKKFFCDLMVSLQDTPR